MIRIPIEVKIASKAARNLGSAHGGMERLAVFPLTIWTACIGAGIATARTHPREAPGPVPPWSA
jgi:hypothetical protein